MKKLLPPSESTPELERLVHSGRCPFNTGSGGPCSKPSERGKPVGACAEHAPIVRAKIARQLPGLEEMARDGEAPVDLALVPGERRVVPGST